MRTGLSAMLPRQAIPQWRALGVGAALCSGVALAAIPAPAEPVGSEELQWRALGIAPLANGGDTGLAQMPTDAVVPIDAAPERAQVALTMVLASSETLGDLLLRAGASRRDAAEAASLVHSAAGALAGGTRVDLVLGPRNGTARSVERVALRAGLALNVELLRTTGGLELRKHAIAIDTTPLRVRGRVGDGLYWSLRAAGVSPRSAAEYLQALATEIDVGSEVSPHDRFDLVIASRRAATGERKTGPLLYAGIDRSADRDLQLVRWSSGGRLNWINAADVGRPSASGMAWPVQAPITSGFGYRVHPILRFARMHRGVDFGADRGTPIVAAADGQVVKAGWAGGYGRQVRIAHAGGLMTSYSHMSAIAADDGALVRRGQVIGYVGSSGLSTGPHLHYEVYRGGVAVNPLSVRFAGAAIDHSQANAVKARLKALLGVGTKG